MTNAANSISGELATGTAKDAQSAALASEAITGAKSDQSPGGCGHRKACNAYS